MVEVVEIETFSSSPEGETKKQRTLFQIVVVAAVYYPVAGPL